MWGTRVVWRSFALATGLALAGCGNVDGIKSQLGLGKQAPDEFRVVSRAPLSLPPDFTLRPPEPGVARPQEGTATQQARTAVFRADGQQQAFEVRDPSDRRSRGERALLTAAGAGGGNADIRQVIDRETEQINEDNQDFIDYLVFWREEEKPGVVIDAEAEASRLRENEALGRPVGTGETPTIERREKAILEDLF
ncbi:MAG: DUF3035 domain-containing protein [Kiloniellales bacterium]|nr:DUF3035 domain-containing protein [Kiloniellales bacterium]